MAAEDEQVELLVSADTDCRANSTASTRAAMHQAHNLIDFDVKYGRKAEVDAASCCDSVMSTVRSVSCKREQVLNFIERHVPVVNLIRTYKVRNRLNVKFCFMQYYLVSGCIVRSIAFCMVAKKFNPNFSELVVDNCCSIQIFQN